ncbi:MAG: isoleucine--tRNA ligase [Myxococcota bacterium]|nr:isoleucine--tRNA ligase [Myxococcota bacterium]
MYKKVEPWVDIIEIEHRIQKFWDETKAFETLRKKNAGGPSWSFLDGPITANNPMGVHHAWGRTLKDAFQRYWAMNGRELRYQNGFDCQGLWVEHEVEKEFGFKSKRDIESYGIDTFVEQCKARVIKFSGIQTRQSIRLGYWMDWDNSYFTMSDENNYTIWSFLKKCHARGKIYRGTDVMPWSGRSGTGYSQMEVVEGRKLVSHEAIFLKFPLRGREKENLLVWTTTPWTLTSNVAAMVGGDLEYVKLRSNADGELYYFAAENLKFERLKSQYEDKKEWIKGVPKLKTLDQIFSEKGGYSLEGYIKGADMVGWTYDGPFDELEAQHINGGFPFDDPSVDTNGISAHRVIDGGQDRYGNQVVVAGEGTGIVHTAPGCGDIDHEVGVKLGLPHIAPLDDSAIFLDKFGDLTGKHALAEETVAFIIGSLKEKNLLVHTEQYPHVYPHCWRSGDPLVFRLVDEWYINMDWRDEIKEVVKQINWIPTWGEERENEWLTNMRDWMISKKRYWGLALPIWLCPKCDHFDVIGSKEELKERAIEGWQAFDGNSPHRPWVDNVKIKCEKCGETASRIPDVGNPWLDAGIVPYSTVAYNTNREYWKKWIPADLVLECFPGQFRNWFYSLLAMSTMMENIQPFKTLVGHALVRDENGQEMHKSSGNAIWFDDAVEKMSADIMRWIYCGHENTSNLNFGYGIAREKRGKFYNTLWNVYSFFVNYARLDKWVPGANPSPVEARPDFDQWILSNLQLTIRNVRKGLETFSTRTCTRAIEQFVEDLSNWYVRHSRRRFWKGDDDADTRMAYETLYACLDVLTRLIAPFMPFTAEEIYQNLVKSHDETAPVSVHHTDFPEVDEQLVDDLLSEDMRTAERLISLSLSAREASKIKVRQPLAKLTIGTGTALEQRAAQRFGDLIREDLNVKALEILEPGSPQPEVPTEWVAKPNLKILGKRLKSKLKAFKAAFAEVAPDIAKAYSAGEAGFRVVVNGEDIALKRTDLIVTEQQAKNVALAMDGDTWASFDTEITEPLRGEGIMRELLRRLQVQRREIGLEIEDRVHLTFATASPVMKTIFNQYADFIKAELLALQLTEGDASGGAAYEIDGETVTVAIEKAD